MVGLGVILPDRLPFSYRIYYSLLTVWASWSVNPAGGTETITKDALSYPDACLDYHARLWFRLVIDQN